MTKSGAPCGLSASPSAGGDGEGGLSVQKKDRSEVRMSAPPAVAARTKVDT